MTEKTIIADEVVSRSIATVQDAVAGFDRFQAGIAAIAAAHPVDVACDLSSTSGMKAAIAGRAAWRDPRIALEKARKAAKAPVLELGKAIDAFAGRIEAQLLIGENNYDGQIKAHEAAVKEAAIARAKAEAERIARHEAGLAMIRSYVQKAHGLDSAKLRLGIETLGGHRYGAEWEEFASKAVIAQTETLETLQSMLNIAVQREEDAAERERQRVENARVAAELAAQKAAMAEKKRLADEAEAEQRAQAAALAEAQRKLDAERAELRAKLDKIAADEAAKEFAEKTRQLEAEQEAALAQIGAAFQADAEANAAQPLTVDPEHDLTHQPELLANLEAVFAEAFPVAAPIEEATLKLGDLNSSLGTGITMSEQFVCQTLGIAKADVPGRAVLFKPSQRNQILEALAEHCLKLRD